MRRAIAARLGQVVPGFRCLAEDLLADRSRVDLFGVDEGGRGVIASIGEREEDALLLIGRALAQRSWVQERLPDWLKLAPALGVRPEAALAAVVLGPAFGSEALAATGALPAGTLSLVAWRFVRNGAGSEVLLERVPVPAGAAQVGLERGEAHRRVLREDGHGARHDGPDQSEGDRELDAHGGRRAAHAGRHRRGEERREREQAEGPHDPGRRALE